MTAQGGTGEEVILDPAGQVRGVRPLRGAALTATRNTRAPVAPGRAALTPQIPADIPALLAAPGVTWREDEDNAAIAVLIPAALAEAIADLAPDPVLFRLAARSAAAGAMSEDERRDLLWTEPTL